MARDVNGRVLIGDDLDLHVGQSVLNARHGLLIAGDGAGGEDHPVALRELHVGMLGLSDARHGGAGFALASGAQSHHFAPRQFGEGRFLMEGKIGVEIARRLRRLDDAKHGAADHDELAAGGARAIGH